MAQSFLKRFSPRGFYGRAALILVVPIITVQLVVSVNFLQRHFEDVTRQMTNNISQDIRLVRTMPEVAPDLGFEWVPGPVTSARVFYDFSGLVVKSTLADAFADLGPVDLDLEAKTVTVAFPEGNLRFARIRVSASNPHQLLVLMVFTSLLMTGVAFLFMRNQIRPITRLARAAEAFGRGRVEPYAPSGALEVRAAGTAFLDMRARIERHIEQRTLMLSGVSHDLRTPLTRMRLELSMMEGPEAEALARDVDEMQGMIDAFLDFAREGAGEQTERVDVNAMVDDLRDAVERTGRVLEVHRPARAVRAAMRPISMRRALDNLVKNGFRYGTRVRISVEPSDTALRLVVEDDGPGIPEADRAQAVKPFARLDAARGTAQGSVGLGLAIVNDVARNHGGSLRLSDSADLDGLRAEIILPRTRS